MQVCSSLHTSPSLQSVSRSHSTQLCSPLIDTDAQISPSAQSLSSLHEHSFPNGTQRKMPGTSCAQHWPAGQLSLSVEHEIAPSDVEPSSSVVEPLVSVLNTVPTVLESVVLVLVVVTVVAVDVLPPSPDSPTDELEVSGPHALAIPAASNPPT